jgi:hypothetical protein
MRSVSKNDVENGSSLPVITLVGWTQEMKSTCLAEKASVCLFFDRIRPRGPAIVPTLLENFSTLNGLFAELRIPFLDRASIETSLKAYRSHHSQGYVWLSCHCYLSFQVRWMSNQSRNDNLERCWPGRRKWKLRS